MVYAVHRFVFVFKLNPEAHKSQIDEFVELALIQFGIL